MYFDSPVGRLAAHFDGECLCRLEFLAGPETEPEPEQAPERVPVPTKAPMQTLARQLRAYFISPANGFDLPLRPAGTAFQQRVWQALRRIPAGETRTYGELAAQLGSSARAVGNACRRNPLPLVVPCHRVVAASGPGGLCGQNRGPAMAIKHWLLRHEGAA